MVSALRHRRVVCLLDAEVDVVNCGDLEVGFVESSSSTLVRERNPHIRSSKV